MKTQKETPETIAACIIAIIAVALLIAYVAVGCINVQ